MINLDIVPSTVRQAAKLLAESLSENEREYFHITHSLSLMKLCWGYSTGLVAPVLLGHPRTCRNL